MRHLLAASIALLLAAASPARAVTLQEGDLLVVDIDQKALFRVDPTTGAQTLVSSGQNFNAPRDVAIAPDGTIYVSDRPGSTISRVDPATGAQTVVSSGQFINGPVGIAMAPDGTLVVANYPEGTLVRLDPRTHAETRITTAGAIPGVYDIAVAPNGTIYGDTQSGGTERICAVNPTTGAVTTLYTGTGAFGSLATPAFTALDGSGGFVFADFGAYAPPAKGAIFRLDLGTDALSTISGSNPGDPGNVFVDPFGVAINPAGSIFVTDVTADRVLLVDPLTGAQTIIAHGSPMVSPEGIAVYHVASVPEPAVTALFALTLLALRRRRRTR